MNKRLEDINSFELVDTKPDKELDEITELASIICNTPISLITILDDKRQWFKSNKGLNLNETKIEDSFCQHAMHKPNEVLVVTDATKDPRFIDNKLVLGYPNIRFYAGAPLVTNENKVLGTLCIIDNKPREFSKDHEKALQILAKKAMGKIESSKMINGLIKTIEFGTDRLIKLTENLPIGLFEMTMDTAKVPRFSFLSDGMKKLHPNTNIEEWIENPNIGFSLIHPDDVEGLQSALDYCVENEEPLYFEYRVKKDAGYSWHAINGSPVKLESGETVIYGSFTDVSHHFEYQSALEQISYDISHVLRRPVTTMLGLNNLIQSDKDLTKKKFMEYADLINSITIELEAFTRKLNKIYQEKKQSITGRNSYDS